LYFDYFTIGTSKCKKPCHSNATCHKGRCICKKGYSGDGVNKCSSKYIFLYC